MDKQTKTDELAKGLSRTSPFVITEYHLPEKADLLENIELKIGFSITLISMVEPYSLYDTLKKYADDLDKTIIVIMDLLAKDIGYGEILEGAITFDLEKGELSEVRYGHYPSFVFRGKLILCTELSIKQIKRRENLAFINRYCHFI